MQAGCAGVQGNLRFLTLLPIPLEFGPYRGVMAQTLEVSPPDSRVKRSPALTWVLLQVTPMPLEPLALAVMPKATPS